MARPEILNGEVTALKARKLTEATCAHFGYLVGTESSGKAVQIAPYRDSSGAIVAQKVRTAAKKFYATGDIKKALPLWGMWLWRDGGKKVVITEGEIDAMSVSQIQGNKWPVVSIKGGAGSARENISKAIEWLDGFDEVILMFDDDEPGREATVEAASVLPPGKAKIATLPLKDASEMLKAGRGREIVDAIWGAKTYRPDGIVNLADIRDEVMRPIEWGLPWAFPTLTSATYGRREGEVYGFGAATGGGKTDVFTQQIAYDVSELGLRPGVIYLEQPIGETGKRIAGKVAGKAFHKPRWDMGETDDNHPPGKEARWELDQLSGALDVLSDKVVLYDHFGETDWDVISAKIRYMAVSEGIKLIYLDHLTAMADPSCERESLETTMKEMAMLAQELRIIIHFISHLSTPDGTPHEEGGRVMIRHFKGSRSIGFWSHFMFGLERDQQAEDLTERRTTTFRVLKDRYTGGASGMTFGLRYDMATGLLSECELGGEDEDGGFPPVDEDDEIPF